MIFRKSHLLFLIILAVLTLSVSNVQAKIDSVITGIDVREVDGTTEIEIMSTTPLTYTMYTSDPYRIILEMQQTSLKGLNKQVFDKAGVMEIVPSPIEGVQDAVKLEISLTDPVDIKPVQKGGTLLLTFNTPAATADSEEELASGAEEARASGQEIDRIELSKSGGKLLVTIGGNTEMLAKVMIADNDKLVIDIPGVTTSVEAPKVFEPPVEGMRIGKHSDKTRLVFDLAGPAVYNISPEGNQIVIAFNLTSSEVAEMPAPLAAEKQEAKEVKSSCVLEPGNYIGDKITLDFQERDENDLVNIFRLMAEISDCNIVLSPQVKGKFSIKLINVPWDQALDIILRNHNLQKIVDGNIIRIVPTKEYAAEEAAIAEAKKARENAGDLVTRTYKVNFAEVAKVQGVIMTSKILSGRGNVSVDPRTSSLIVNDVEKNQERVQQIVETLDKPTPQVNIDARIVEVSKGFTQEFGIQWGANIRPTAETAVGGLSSTGFGNTGFTSGNPLLINLPAAVGAGTGGAIGFGYLGASALRALDLQLSAMEDTGNGKLVSNPRIITLDNEPATIKQGESIPYPGTAEGGGTVTQFVNADLELTVTPHITPDGTIVMEVDIKKNEPDFSRQVNSTPAINKKEAKTKVLIMDGDTLVIGGIFKTTISESENKFPGLGNVPILGWLFKKQKQEQKSEELLIFITPSIIK